MGCNCAGATGQTIAQRHAQRAQRGLGAVEGSDISAPKLIGNENGETIRVRVIVPVEGMRIASSVWVTGDGVQTHIRSGALLDITTTEQKSRGWTVNGMWYSDFQKASRVAASLETVPIEVF